MKSTTSSQGGNLNGGMPTSLSQKEITNTGTAAATPTVSLADAANNPEEELSLAEQMKLSDKRMADKIKSEAGLSNKGQESHSDLSPDILNNGGTKTGGTPFMDDRDTQAHPNGGKKYMPKVNFPVIPQGHGPTRDNHGNPLVHLNDDGSV